MGPPPDSPPRVSGRNGHRLLPPHREMEGILAPLARTFAPWFTGRDTVMVMAALAEAGKMRPAWVMRFWSKAVTWATVSRGRNRRGPWPRWRGALSGAVEELRPQSERRAT